MNVINVVKLLQHTVIYKYIKVYTLGRNIINVNNVVKPLQVPVISKGIK